MSIIKNNKNLLLRTLLIFILYFSMNKVFSMILGMCGVSSVIVSNFISDILFFSFIVYLYRNDIKHGYDEFFKNGSGKKNLLFALKIVLLLLVINVVGGIISSFVLSSSTNLDENTNSIYKLTDASAAYTIFKTLIFASFAEELIFKKSIRDIISNDNIFMVISALIYSIVNIMYFKISLINIVDMIQCFIFAFILARVYVNKNNNIFMVIFIKFVYTIVPLVLMLTNLGGAS